jgi:hypothetical protein
MSLTLFISYSHQDTLETDWRSRLEMYLAPLWRKRGLEIWSDKNIEPGAPWLETIDQALLRSTLAVFLVGPGFLASDFIMGREAPLLLKNAQTGGLRLFPMVVGYCAYQDSPLGVYQAFNDPKQPLESLPVHSQNYWLNKLCGDLDKLLGAVPEKQAKANESLKQGLDILSNALGNSQTAFAAQCRRRDNLVSMIEARLGIHIDLEYEHFFFRHFPSLTPEEKFEFDQIRSITEGLLYPENLKVVDALYEYPVLIKELPLLSELQRHLVFWINKYERVFTQNPSMCLLYTGVEDGVPFPKGMDAAVLELKNSMSS